MKYFILTITIACSISIFPPLFVSADDKTQALKLLQGLVNNPSEARKMRAKIKNASAKELMQYEELRTIIESEINTMSSSLPQKIDKYTTMVAATISGNNIVFVCIFSDDMVGIEYKEEVMAEMDKYIKNSFCSSPSGAWLVFGYTWSYFYQLENGEYYGGIVIDANSCGFE